jgi:hypothetical protein
MFSFGPRRMSEVSRRSFFTFSKNQVSTFYEKNGKRLSTTAELKAF